MPQCLCTPGTPPPFHSRRSRPSRNQRKLSTCRFVPSFVTNQRYHAVPLRDVFARFEQPEFQHVFYCLEELPNLCEAFSYAGHRNGRAAWYGPDDVVIQMNKNARHVVPQKSSIHLLNNLDVGFCAHKYRLSSATLPKLTSHIRHKASYSIRIRVR